MSAGGGVHRSGRAFAAVVLLSLYVLFWPSPAGAGLSIPGADKLVHLLLFLLLAGTAALRFGATTLVLVLALGYAVGSELVQAWLLTGRSGDALDVLADGVGAAAAWHVVRRRRSRG